MMSTIFTLNIILSICTILLAFRIVDKRIVHTDDMDNSSAAPDIISDAADYKKNENKWWQLSVDKWIVLIMSVISIACISCRLSAFELEHSLYVKCSIAALVLLAAAIIDYYMMKIPNMLSVILLLSGMGSLIYEFIYSRDFIRLSLIGSVAGAVICFMLLLVMSLITKGGFGMGDVKLISSFAFLMKPACVFYSVTYGMMICLVVTVILLAIKRKGMKDEIPFAPFIYFGYVVAILLGTF